MGILPGNGMLQDQSFPLCIHCWGIVQETKQLLDRGELRLRLHGGHSQAVRGEGTRGDNPKFIEILWDDTQILPLLPEGIESVKRIVVHGVTWLRGAGEDVRVESDAHSPRPAYRLSRLSSASTGLTGWLAAQVRSARDHSSGVICARVVGSSCC